MAFYRAKRKGGGGAGYSGYANIVTAGNTTSRTLTISNKNGSKLIVLAFITTTSSTAYDRLDGTTASGGTISKINNLRTMNTTTYGTFFNLSVTSNSCTLTAPYACLWQVFEAQ